MLAAREAWKACMSSLPADKLVFVDESGAKTNMTRFYGWAPRGERAVEKVPHGHWATQTMISSIRSDGTSACMTVDGATDTEVFLAYALTTLIPSLREGDIVILDNLSPHRSPRVVKAINEAGALVLFLPPYSPDFNPIEQMWSKVKATLRRIGAGTLDELADAINFALAGVSADNAISWFENSGYIFI